MRIEIQYGDNAVLVEDAEVDFSHSFVGDVEEVSVVTRKPKFLDL